MASSPARLASDSQPRIVGPSTEERGKEAPGNVVNVEKQVFLDSWDTDLENPRNWSFRRKWMAVFVVSVYTLIGPLSSSMMAPGLPLVALEYGITNPTVIAMTLSIFLLSYAIAPLVWAPLSEMYGRNWPLHASSVATVAFNLGCAFSPNTATLVVMRFFAGLTSSAPIAIGAGSISDVFSTDDRGSAMAIYSLGPLLGTSLGPVPGGFLVERIGIKWVFIVLAAWGALCSIVGVLTLQETYGPIVRVGQAAKSGQLEELLALHPELISARQNKLNIIWLNISRPTVLLFCSLILFLLGLYRYLIIFGHVLSHIIFRAVTYGIYFLMFSMFGEVFSTLYGFNAEAGGLVYLGLGVGYFISTAMSAKWSDSIYLAMRRRNGGVSKPEHRLLLLFPGAILLPIGLFWYGWSANPSIHWIMPIIGTGIFAFAQMMTFLPIQLYLVDTFTFAASATSAASVFRSLLGFIFPLFASQLFNGIGIGPGNSLLAGIAIVLGIPFPLWIYFKGEKLRQRSKHTR
ncbi:multidrug resistance protein 4 [Flagelloscypha sp. PMI_526]|nr:multidrug resistance protein 4 [Flagelloscypha sp. PMI_526]